MSKNRAEWIVVLCLVACGGQSAQNATDGSSAGHGGVASGSGGSSAGSSTLSSGAAGTHAEAGRGGTPASGGSSSGGKGGTAGASAGGSNAGAPNGGGGAAAGSSPGGNTSGGAVTTAEMLVPTVKAFCAAARTCCVNQQDPVMLDDCESSYGMRSETSQALMRGTVTIDGTDLAKCQAAYQAAATACEENSVLAACTGIVHGKVAAGQSCYSGLECSGAEPHVCLITEPAGKVGTCQSVSRGKAGDECSGTCRPNDSCSFTVLGVPTSALTPCYEKDGVYCDIGTSPSKCKAIRATGAACDQDDQCGSESYCDTGGNLTCKKRSRLDEACGMCIPSLMCVNGKCKSPPLTVGSTCQGYSLGPY